MNHYRQHSSSSSRRYSSGKVFFRLISKEKKLSLPLKFLRKFRDELSSVANLMMPNGHVWQVQLRKAKDEIVMFGSSLNDMFKYYSICLGHFLIFKYKGMSNFSVRILDKTTCEIEYTFHQPQNQQENDTSAEILKNHGVAFKRMKSKAKNDGIGMTPQVEQAVKIHTSHKLEKTLLRMSLETNEAVELALNSKLKNPSFLILVLNNNIRRNVMFVPSGFACKYLKGVYGKIKVVDHDGREWIVDTKFFWRGRSMSLQKGWSKFYRDNCLVEGDVCLFELVSMRDIIVLKVSIFPI